MNTTELKPDHSLNPVLTGMAVYASKAISLQAKNNPDVANLSFGEPVFGPPEYLLEAIANEDLSIARFLDAAKRYESPRGSLALRQAIAHWYLERYGLVLDPECEIMVTHGGVEAITLALLSTTAAGESVAISDPSYMLYARTIQTLERKVKRLTRPAGVHEYTAMLADPAALDGVKTMIINSPENPSGYMLSDEDWQQVAHAASRNGTWIIHDEVYDAMAFERRHRPARAVEGLADNAIIINSFSKKFGLPGLRIGWLVAPAPVIEQAAKAHDYLYLGVNIQYEQIATRLLRDGARSPWLQQVSKDMRDRATVALSTLGAEAGFAWPRKPLGAMFLFPEVSAIYRRMPEQFRTPGLPVGDAVARYLMDEVGVAVVPGSVYGPASNNHVRMVLCTPQEEFERALQRLAALR